jgi:carbon storage regulator
MLVLSRKPGERLHIGNGITITVVAVQGRQVRLGIEAPAVVPVRRAELALRQDRFLGRHVTAVH